MNKRIPTQGGVSLTGPDRVASFTARAVALLLLVLPQGPRGAPADTMMAGPSGAGNRFDAYGRLVESGESGRLSYVDEPVVLEPRTTEPSVGCAKSTRENPVSNPLVTLEWHRASWGTGIGKTGMVIADLDRDQDLEMVLAASDDGFNQNNYWYVVDHDGLSYGMERAVIPGDDVFGLAVKQADSNDEAPEIVVVLRGRLRIFDGISLELKVEWPVTPTGVGGFAMANVDGDPAVEAALCNALGTWVYDLTTGAEQLALPGVGCSDLAVGETDGTGGREIVITYGGDDGLVIDAVTGAVEWTQSGGFGDRVTVGDVDGDGFDEIVAEFTWSGLFVWNGDTRDLAWVMNDGFYPVAVVIGDVEGDGPVEVVYGEGQWGEVHVLDGATGVEKWSVLNPEHGVTGIAIGDLDEDGVREIFFGAGYTSTGEDYLFVVDTVAHTRVWNNLDFRGPYYGMSAGDIDADGDRELIYTSFESNSSTGDGRYFIHDAVTKELEYLSPRSSATGVKTEFWDIGLEDVDSDSELEIVHPATYVWSGAVQCRDGNDHTLQWEAMLPRDTTYGSFEIADLDDDDTLEVITGTRLDDIGLTGVFVLVHDAATGELEWQSPDLQALIGAFVTPTLLRVGDVDDDESSEIVVAGRGLDLVALDPVTGSLDVATHDLGITALELVDSGFGGPDEIVIGTESGLLMTVDVPSGAATTVAGPYAGAVDGLAVVDLTSDGVADYVFAVEDQVYLVDGGSLENLWVSPRLGDGVGRHDSLIVEDLDNDGLNEIWVNAGKVGHFVFEVASSESLVFLDGFESGDTSVWSSTSP